MDDLLETPEWAKELRATAVELAVPPSETVSSETKTAILNKRRRLFGAIADELSGHQRNVSFTPWSLLRVATQSVLIKHLLTDHFNPYLDFEEPIDIDVYYLKGYPMRTLVELLSKIVRDEVITWPIDGTDLYIDQKPSKHLGGWDGTDALGLSEGEREGRKQKFQRVILSFMKYIDHLEPGSVGRDSIPDELQAVYQSIDLRAYIQEQWSFNRIIHDPEIPGQKIIDVISKTRSLISEIVDDPEG